MIGDEGLCGLPGEVKVRESRMKPPLETIQWPKAFRWASGENVLAILEREVVVVVMVMVGC